MEISTPVVMIVHAGFALIAWTAGSVDIHTGSYHAPDSTFPPSGWIVQGTIPPQRTANGFPVPSWIWCVRSPCRTNGYSWYRFLFW